MVIQFNLFMLFSTFLDTWYQTFNPKNIAYKHKLPLEDHEYENYFI